jgi:hypothetical protein
MRHRTLRHITLIMFGALAFAVPAKAQLINGHNSIDNPLPEAPIGAKAGGSAASLRAPGGLDAARGALQNDWEWRHGRMMVPGDQLDASNSKYLANAGKMMRDNPSMADANQNPPQVAQNDQ